MSDSVKTVRATARDGQTKELLRLTRNRKRSRHRFKQPAQFAAERLVATASISDFGLPIPHFRNPQSAIAAVSPLARMPLCLKKSP